MFKGIEFASIIIHANGIVKLIGMVVNYAILCISGSNI